jgi:hypothetical protein
MKEWRLALVEAWRFYLCIIPIYWWAWPFKLPIPPKRFIKFRLDTAYGEVAHGWPRPPWRVIILDTKRFLLWRRKERLRQAGEHSGRPKSRRPCGRHSNGNAA